MHAHHFRESSADLEDRIHGGHASLNNHGDPPRPRFRIDFLVERDQILSVELD